MNLASHSQIPDKLEHYPEVDRFINSLSSMRWRKILAAYSIKGNFGIIDVIRMDYPERFITWGDFDILFYLLDRKLSDFLPAAERSRG